MAILYHNASLMKLNKIIKNSSIKIKFTSHFLYKITYVNHMLIGVYVTITTMVYVGWVVMLVVVFIGYLWLVWTLDLEGVKAK
ncbi:hypothetical protein tloyanaT_09930 [Thalassotalea loyana]|uniref:Uncharacterized protein n=1 Tax=Thalassotalea loyana TaxID=280483 RepID=A0ABQ6HE23_9GAMM|nr:hypothetical protein tloyanaT_09930 [Thalassotalea loyana]